MDTFSVSGKKVLLLCPENPYGAEIAEGLSSAGAEIWLAGDRHTDIPATGSFFYTHGSPASAAELANAVKTRMGSVDVIIENCLHTEHTGWKQSFSQIHSQLQKTHLGLMLTLQHLGHILTEQKHGSVIVITDYGALVGYDPQNYTQAPEQLEKDLSFANGFIKGAAVNYVRQASNFLAEHGCRCNAIAFAPISGTVPKEFEAAFLRHSQIKRLATKEDVASAVIFLASNASRYITGITLPVDGGYTAK